MPDTPELPKPNAASRPADPSRAGEGHTTVQVDRVPHRAAESASDKPTPHDTPHEVDGAPVRSPADVEDTDRPGSSNEATKQVPP
jgi:hypothetical protein